MVFLEKGAGQKALAICFVLMTVFVTFAAALTETATAEVSGDYRYSLTNGGSDVEITGYIGSGGDISIPGIIEGKPVTSIGDNAFEDQTTITSVEIPEGIQAIGSMTFSNCTHMVSISLPNSLSSIGYGAFDQCFSLKGLNFPESLRVIGWYAFWQCQSLDNISLPNGLESIGEGAFINCFNLTTLTIPDTITTIGPSMCGGCFNLTHVKLSKNLVAISDRAFTYCNSLKAIEIPDSVTSIGKGAFVQCFDLTNVTIPNSVTGIGDIAFKMCTSLTTVTIGSNVTAIGNYAFENCSALGTINFLGSKAPAVGLGWLDNSSTAAIGHAYASSNFPKQGENFFGLTMGKEISVATVPGTPTDLHAEIDGGIIKLTWKAPADNGGKAITGYKVYKSIDPNFMNYLSTVSNTSYEDSNVSLNVTYYYNVVAVNDVGPGQNSSTVIIRMDGGSTPTPGGGTIDGLLLLTCIIIGLMAGIVLVLFSEYARLKKGKVGVKTPNDITFAFQIIGMVISIIILAYTIYSSFNPNVRIIFAVVLPIPLVFFVFNLFVYYKQRGGQSTVSQGSDNSTVEKAPEEKTQEGKAQ